MDLTHGALPNIVEVGGNAYSVYTDFRKWMRFEIEVKRNIGKKTPIDIHYLFKNEHPLYCDISDLFVFSRPKRELPRRIGKFESNVIVFDYELDAELIYAAFMEQYGIDLIDIPELHWHKFLALMHGLNDGTMLREVMRYRCYEKNTDKKRDIYQELKDAWEIIPYIAEEQEELDTFSSLFS